MILVTLGTQDKKFNRLLEKIEYLIENGVIKDKVVVQSGVTDFNSNNMEVFSFIDRNMFDKLISECDILITHGGVGSILSGLLHKKKVIAVARLAKYDEHENDHQIQIVDKFREEGYILGCLDANDFDGVYKFVDNFIGREYIPGNDKMLSIIETFIDSI